MSSILDALKKLEKEKIHRDEVSTAIASDILRSGRKAKAPPWRTPLALFLLAIAAAALAILLFHEPAPIAVSQSGNLSPPETVKKTAAQPVEAVVRVATSKPLPTNLPILSGVVYQQQENARMAILNDLPVMEGTVIAGYTLQEIFPDRVVLTRAGQSFTLTLDSAND